MPTRSAPPVPRAWIVIGCSALLMALTVGSRSAFGLFVSPLNSATGLGLATISFAVALSHLVWLADIALVIVAALVHLPLREVAFVVADAWQRQGLGRKLMSALLKHARSAGYERVEGEAAAAGEPQPRFPHFFRDPRQRCAGQSQQPDLRAEGCCAELGMLVAGFPCWCALPHRSHLPQAVSFKMAMDANAHEKRTVDNALLVEGNRAQITFDSIGDGVICTDKEGKVTYLNLIAERMTGWTRDEAIGRMFTEVFRIIHCETRDPVPNPMELAIRQNGAVGLPANTVLVRRDGLKSAIEDSTAPIHDQGGQIVGGVMVFRDVGKAQVMQSNLTHLSQHDFLTGLPNRMLLNDRLKSAMALARRHGTKVAVLFVDVDRFKQINDLLGHSIGDKVLQVLGKRLEKAVRESDTVCRHGGDEFVIVLSEVEHAQNAARHAEKIHAVLSPPHTVAQHELRVSVSIGVSVFPDDGQDAETLVECADAAMYHAKESGRNNFRVFKAGMKRLGGTTANAQGPVRPPPQREDSTWQTRRTVSAVQSDTRSVRDD